MKKLDEKKIRSYVKWQLLLNLALYDQPNCQLQRCMVNDVGERSCEAPSLPYTCYSNPQDS